MPTYEYRCPEGHEFEVFQRMSDEPVASCPECGEKAERLISAGGGLLFKGEGFYITDYRSESYRKEAKAEAESSSNPDKGSGSRSGGQDKKDAKPGGEVSSSTKGDTGSAKGDAGSAKGDAGSSSSASD